LFIKQETEDVVDQPVHILKKEIIMHKKNSNHSMKPWSWSLTIVLLWGLLLGVTNFGMAHSGEGLARHVSNDGQDTGDCTDPGKPCQTIMYAINQSQKGDMILVAEGAYEFDPAEIDLLLSDLKPVQGGYDRNAFAAKTLSDRPTYVTGPSHKYRAQLADRGLTLLQDPKGLEIERSIQERSTQVEGAPQPSTPCVAGKAGEYPCKGVDFLSRVALNQLSTNPSSANDIWGLVDLNDNREYAIIGLRNGTAVIDVTDPVNPIEVGSIPGRESSWRDVKVYQFKDEVAGRWKAYAYVTSEDAVLAALKPQAIEQGLQIIDLTKLPNSISLAGTYKGFKSAHNIYIGNVDYKTGVALPGLTPYAYILGSNLNDGQTSRGGAFRILDLKNPVAPVEITVPPIGTEYVHDATSLVITDARTTACAPGHNPCELYIDYNEDSVDIWDVTDKSAPHKISSTDYPGSSYTHSGWWTKDKMHLFIQDELDEQRSGDNTTLRVMDISNLNTPVVDVAWTGPTKAIDHNGFVKDDQYYMSTYRRGLTILDIKIPTKPKEAAFFDTYPESDSTNFSGAWGVYPYLPSGTILVSDIQRGLFLLVESIPTPPQPPGPTTACPAIGVSGQFPFNENKKVSSNANILQATIHLQQEMAVHINTNTSVRALDQKRDFRTGLYNQESPNAMWTQSYRPITIPETDRWVNFGSTFSLRLKPGSHTIYWKIWISGAQLEFSSSSMSVEGFCIPVSSVGETAE
jgi:choice-of-anchor B domain-containing protein